MEATDLENKQLFRSGIGDRNFIERFCSRESVQAVPTKKR